LLAITALKLTGNEVPADEAGVIRQRVRELHAGLYVWLSALAVQTAVSLYAMAVSGRRPQAVVPETEGAVTTATSESESSRSMSTGR
jgi:hypothetical protein